MFKKLKFKILAGFGLLIGMLILAGTVSILEFARLSRSVNSLLEDNYKTIKASKSMLEALEREDSGILLLILGQREVGQNILRSSDSLFDAAFNIARDNVTEPHEDEYIGEVSHDYSLFKSDWEHLLVDVKKEASMGWYNDTIHRDFLEVKNAVNELMTLNQNGMYNMASQLKEKSHRALMPGIVSIIAAVVFSLLLNFFISRYFVSPIIQLVEALQNHNIASRSLNVNIISKDEIKMLENEINGLIRRISG
jgi:HAMP domain-containing protein